ncbi:LysR family transcriptional regulator [Burkholderia multivorans]|uniref:LysR family transcriptional regulator n=1 Tax=Burkholderia multivorans TaxID=87883 RepID=UPI00158B775D|nr:LysR family transcriptional regulator [Burkholderia multivorans]MDR8876560.1 Nodulation protein D 2 [Burkholderia multivorans]MDR8882411.1 Nodulation protein D 2 [Burkholderia multivorans]MDR8888771.1 Nodulation protein D 2 [Burkholderia multivorans]MDR8895972.1 Nodulation protein D 2 [Burkholderia multivorans]MDR8901999.1 Nodulation protein D 2 [Burkholderia multivorans]
MDRLSILRRLNLNLLPIMYELLKTGSVTEAAARLNLTQSTVSGSLRQLRGIFGDDLLVPVGRQMIPTTISLKLFPELERLIGEISNFVYPETFDPNSSAREFNLFMADYFASFIMPNLLTFIKSEAPSVSVRINSHPRVTWEQMRRGIYDVAVIPDRPENWANFGNDHDHSMLDVKILFEEKMVGVRRATSAGAKMTIEEYLNHPHVQYFRDDKEASIEQAALQRYGYAQYTKIYVPNFWLIPKLVVEDNLIGVLPQSFAKMCSHHFAIDVFAPPIQIDPFSVVAITLNREIQHADIVWILYMIEKAIGRGSRSALNDPVGPAPGI